MTEVNLDRFYKFIKLKKLNEAENEIRKFDKSDSKISSLVKKLTK